MSEVKTEKLSPRVTSLQLGDSGDTFTVPSGATLDINGTADFAGATLSGLTTGKVLQYQIKQGYSGQIVVDNNTTYTSAGTSWNISITPAATTSKIIVIWGSLINPKGTSSYQGRLKIYRQIASGGYSDIDGQADSVPQMTITASDNEIIPVNTFYTDTTHNTTSQIDYQIYMSTSNNMVCEFADTTSYRYISAMEIGA